MKISSSSLILALVTLVLGLLTLSSVKASSLTRFNKTNVEQGLPHNSIWDINQDDKGYIWLATSKGLVRYDGYEFLVFRNNTPSKSNSGANVIRTIFANESGDVFVGTYNGVALVDASTNSLINLDISLNETEKLFDVSVYDVVEVNQSLWLATDNGLIEIDANKKKARFITKDTKAKIRINSLIKVDENTLIVGSVNGAFLFDVTTKKVSWLEGKNKESDSIRVYSTLKRKNGDLMIGAAEGLFKVHLESLEYSLVSTELKNKLVYTLTEDLYERLFVGTQDSGLFFEYQNHQFTQHLYSKDNDKGISDSDINTIFTDSSGVVWIGTFNSGLNRLGLNATSFQIYDDSQQSVPCLTSPVIYSVHEESKDILWLGSHFGLARFDRRTKDCKLYSQANNTDFFIGDQVTELFESDSYPSFLFAVTVQGVNAINLKTQKVENVKTIFTGRQGIYKHLSFDGKEYLSSVFGLYEKDESNSKLILHQSGLNKPYSSQFFSVTKTSTNDFFIPSPFGLMTKKPGEDLKYVNWLPENLKDRLIKVLMVDSKDQVWLAYDNLGLYVFTSDGNLVHKFEDSVELHTLNEILSIVEYSNDSIWLTGINGLARIDLHDNSIRNFHVSDGLPGENFIKRSEIVTEDGSLFFGNRKGLLKFRPNEIKEDNTPPKVQLTKFIYFNEAFLQSSKKKSFSLPTDISNLQQLELTHNDYVFGFEFAGLHYADPTRNNYAFKLENWDQEWNYVDAKSRKVTYSNLPAGDYTFKVKASNSQGVWTEEPFELSITIHPPWWKTYWAFAAYVITLLFSIFLYVSYRTKSLEARAQQLEINVEERTKELAAEKDKVEQLLSRKNEEFANVSHEFRTPLTLILGPIAQLLKRKHESEETQKLSVVQRNGYRLLRMVDQLLNLETFRVKSITQRSSQAIGQTTQMLAEAFQDLAEEKSLTFKINEIEPINFEFTPDAIEKIVLNLLSNAIKYTPAGGSIEVSAHRTGENYQITISDTGIGIPEDKVDSVFDRFNRVMDANSEKVTGAGIGLSLVKSLIESHGGEINLQSEHGKGTTITVTLPVINEVKTIDGEFDSNREIIAMELMSLKAQEVKSFEAETEIHDSSNKPSILVIEDNPDMRNYIGQSISDDYQVLMAEDGVEGLEQAKKHVPDLIISDVMMPRMDGYQTTNELRQDDITSHIPVLLLTARGDRESRLKGWYEKADEYITKPFDVEELKIRVNNLLEIRNILKKRFSEIVFETVTESPEVKAPEDLDVVTEEDLEENKARLQQAFIEKMNSVLEKHYQDSEFSIEELASKIAMSERQLFRKLRSVLDMTPGEYIRRYRLEKSKLLLSSGKNATYAAIDVGFSSQSYFSRCFKAQYGISPSQFSKQ